MELTDNKCIQTVSHIQLNLTQASTESLPLMLSEITRIGDNETTASFFERIETLSENQNITGTVPIIPF